MITASRLMEKVLFKFAGQWIAGDTYADALLSAKQANEKGMRCIVNMLGEYHTSRNLINNTTENYKGNEQVASAYTLKTVEFPSKDIILKP